MKHQYPFSLQESRRKTRVCSPLYGWQHQMNVNAAVSTSGRLTFLTPAVDLFCSTGIRLCLLLLKLILSLFCPCAPGICLWGSPPSPWSLLANGDDTRSEQHQPRPGPSQHPPPQEVDSEQTGRRRFRDEIRRCLPALLSRPIYLWPIESTGDLRCLNDGRLTITVVWENLCLTPYSLATEGLLLTDSWIHLAQELVSWCLSAGVGPKELHLLHSPPPPPEKWVEIHEPVQEDIVRTEGKRWNTLHVYYIHLFISFWGLCFLTSESRDLLSTFSEMKRRRRKGFTASFRGVKQKKKTHFNNKSVLYTSSTVKSCWCLLLSRYSYN